MFSSNLLNHFSNIEKIILETGGFVEGNLFCANTVENITVERNKNKILNLQKFVSKKSNICEIGVNAGHSLLIMLDTNPVANYQLFDIGMHTYTEKCLEYIKTQYPSTNIDIVYGDSKITLPNYIKKSNKKFDIIHVDGGHDDNCVKSDFNYSLELIDNNGYIIFDDYNLKNIKRFINSKLNKEIVEVTDNFYIKTEYHIIYRKNNHE
jgi:predicted O-methyltransferase YrrM